MSVATKIAALVNSATLVDPKEQKSVVLSFLFIFVLMAAYFMLRPVRDAMASDWSNTEISVIWNIQFFLSLGLVALYGFAVARFRFKYLVPAVYVFFAVSFIAFHFGSAFLADALPSIGLISELESSNQVLLDKGFYLCLSLFGLFHMSVFWSMMSDLFSQEQSRRLFAFIYMGASAGAIAGPLSAALVVQFLGSEALMLTASCLMLLPLPIVFYLQGSKQAEMPGESQAIDQSQLRIGGAPLAGFKQFFSSPYLIGIAAFILLYTAISSFAYFEQLNFLRDYELDQRTQILALLSLVVNILTFVLGFFTTSRLTTRLGMPYTLALVPALMCAALLVLAFAPLLIVLVALQVTRQAGNYGVTRPAREMLYTVVSRESRFKAKPVVDVVIYRGGDAIWGSAFAFLTDGVGLGIAAMAAIGAGIAAVWAGVGLVLGSVFNKRDKSGAVEVLE